MLTITNGVTPRQHHAIQLLLAGMTITAAARKIGVERKTIHRWLRKPAFRAALERVFLTIMNSCLFRIS